MSAPSLSSEAHVATESASRYLQQLCKHWAHKRQVTNDATQGRIDFDAGFCELKADSETLIMKVSASEENSLPVLEDVVERHLKRFAFRETLDIRWSRQGASA